MVTVVITLSTHFREVLISVNMCAGCGEVGGVSVQGGGAAAAANAAPVAVSNVPSTLFGRAKQCAPEVQMFSSQKCVFLDVVVFLYFLCRY